MERNKDYSYLLTGAIQVGCQGHIDFSHENERLIFLSSYDNIEVIPLLHRNTTSFIGMKNRNTFLATRVVDGRFIGLGNKGKLYSWDLITGKLLPSKEAPRITCPGKQIVEPNAYDLKKYKDYELYTWVDEDEGISDSTYKKEWYKKILLKKKDFIQDFDYKNFHGHGGIDEEIENQVSYNQRIEKKFFEFKVIEIVSDCEIVEHLTFIHPIYPDTVQFLYFSDDLKYLYERQKYERHFLYQIEPTGVSNIVNYKYIHRFHHIPVDLLNVTQYPFIFSPNFTRYLDCDP